MFTFSICHFSPSCPIVELILAPQIRVFFRRRIGCCGAASGDLRSNKVGGRGRAAIRPISGSRGACRAFLQNIPAVTQTPPAAAAGRSSCCSLQNICLPLRLHAHVLELLPRESLQELSFSWQQQDWNKHKANSSEKFMSLLSCTKVLARRQRSLDARRNLSALCCVCKEECQHDKVAIGALEHRQSNATHHANGWSRCCKGSTGAPPASSKHSHQPQDKQEPERPTSQRLTSTLRESSHIDPFSFCLLQKEKSLQGVFRCFSLPAHQERMQQEKPPLIPGGGFFFFFY